MGSVLTAGQAAPPETPLLAEQYFKNVQTLKGLPVDEFLDTMGMKMEKQQSDFFRHTILGLGAGDLIVKTSGATNEHFDLHNVLWINWKVQKIEDMLGKKKVMESK